MSVTRRCLIALIWLITGVDDPCPHACRGAKNSWRMVVTTDFIGSNDLAARPTDHVLPSRQATSNGRAPPQSP